MFKKSIFLFRRDLRLEDNTSLLAALERSNEVIPLFILDPKQVKDNPYKSDNSIQFMIQSLKALDVDLASYRAKLSLCYGDTLEVLKQIFNEEKIDALFLNMDYTPFARKRDENIESLCRDFGVEFFINEDYGLNNIIGSKPYKVFTPYYNLSKEIKVKEVRYLKEVGLLKEVKSFSSKFLNLRVSSNISFEEVEKLYVKNESVLPGGRSEALKLIEKIKNDFSIRAYSKDVLTDHTMLSPHLKFGTISIREAFHGLKDLSEELIRQLYWRDFWMSVTYNNPSVITESYLEQFKDIKWNDNLELFEKWKKGETGVPIIDAGMRQLNLTGFMNNRVRMLTASFLTKNLFIDWRLGAKYFANKLVDYCPMQNQNNWQSVAGSGISSLPWFRVMNPFLQQEKYDPNCEYIKKWLPELKKFSVKEIQSFNGSLPYLSSSEYIRNIKERYR